MIVGEYVIRSIIDTFPLIQINPTTSLQPKFHWGDEAELNRYIKLKKEASYPLIWLLPSEDRYEGSRFQNLVKDCSFIIATRENRVELFNDQRYIKTFDLVLNPLQDYLVQGLTKSDISERVDNNFTIFKHPNYSAESEANATIDIWDAIKLDITVRFKEGKCLKPINYG